MQVLGAPHFSAAFREMQSSSKVGELKTNFLFWDKEPLHLVEKEKGLVPYLDFFSSTAFTSCISWPRDLVFNQKITKIGFTLQ